jgi:tetratricopeptide (TPR) repeat protein
MKETAETTWYLLDRQRPFSQSVLWDLQRNYFSERGIGAWSKGEVPHYVTSNPTLANSYAEIVFACWRDQQRLAPSSEPMYLCELGAGSGRFAFHFLKRLARLCELAEPSLTSFRYVLTDFTQSNLDYWRGHPCFRTFFESGVLDIALFDINQSDQLALQLSGKTITAESLNRPLVVIANYVFDSVAQELFYFDDRHYHQCLVSLLVNEDPDTLTTTELLERVQCHYDHKVLTEPPYQEPYLQQLLADYNRTLTDTYLLFPAAGLRCLQRLKALSKQGLLSLSADKGDHRLEAFQGMSPPRLVCHGSFSFSVNYHAFKTVCEQSDGIALFPLSPYRSLNVSCLLMLTNAASYTETQRAYQRYVQDFGPDEFFTITGHARQYIPEMKAADILAYLRLSYYDSHQFEGYLPRLMELAPELNHRGRLAVSDACDKVWESYFPLGESLDLAYQIGCLLYEIDDCAHALTYFERSIEIYGQHAGTLFNMAACHESLGQFGHAESLLRTVLKYDPDNQQARALLTEMKEVKKTRAYDGALSGA